MKKGIFFCMKWAATHYWGPPHRPLREEVYQAWLDLQQVSGREMDAYVCVR